MKDKGENCWSITRDELLEVLRAGAVVHVGKFGPLAYDPRESFPYRELHPRLDTVRRLIRSGLLVDAGGRPSFFENYRLADTADKQGEQT